MTLTCVTEFQEDTGFTSERATLVTPRSFSANETHLWITLFPASHFFIHRPETVRVRISKVAFSTKTNDASVDFVIAADTIDPSTPAAASNAVAASAMSASVASAFVAAAPTVATGALRSAGLLFVERCDFQVQPGPESIPTHGFVLPLGSSALRVFVGMVVFNTTFVAFVAGSHLVRVYFHRESSAATEAATGGASASSFFQSAARLGFPLRFVAPTSLLLLQNTVSAALAIVVHGDDVPLQTRVIMGLLVAPWLAGALWMVSRTTIRPFPAFFVEWCASRPAPASWWSGAPRFLVASARGVGHWEDDDLFSSTNTGYVLAYGALFQLYRPSRQWFFAIEVLASIATAVLLSIRPQFHECVALGVAGVTVFGLYLLALLILRPYHAPLNLVMATLLAVCQVLACVFLVVEMRTASAISSIVGLSLAFTWGAAILLTLPKRADDKMSTLAAPLVQAPTSRKKKRLVGASEFLERSPGRSTAPQAPHGDVNVPLKSLWGDSESDVPLLRTFPRLPHSRTARQHWERRYRRRSHVRRHEDESDELSSDAPTDSDADPYRRAEARPARHGFRQRTNSDDGYY